jgi:predicted dienelactone hydrolase
MTAVASSHFARSTGLAFTLAVVACGTGSPPTGIDAAVDAEPADAITPLDAATDTAPPTDAPPTYTFPDVLPTVGDPLALDPRMPGPFHAGYRTLQTTYMPVGASTPRTITVHVWYPTNALTGPAATYVRLFRDPLSLVGAPPVAPVHAGGRYPVQVYSHGDRGFGGTSAFMMRYFASHGWVSVAPDHLGNTLVETPQSPRPYALYHLRSQDVTAALDAVLRLAAPDPLANTLGATRAVLSGHSFGTHTVWASVGASFDLAALRTACTPAVACTPADLTAFASDLHDERFVAGILMAGSIKRDLFGPNGHASVTVPLLSMSGSDDPVGADAQFESTAPVPMEWFDVRGACHQFFALGGCENVPDSEQDRIVSAWALAFSRKHVLADGGATTAALLDGSSPVSDRVTLRQR